MPNVSQRRQLARACQRCRNFKTRCDKEKPRCTRCARVGATCEYSDYNPPSLVDFSGGRSSPILDEAILLSAPDPVPCTTIPESENGYSGNSLPQPSDPMDDLSNNSTLPEKPRLRRERAILSCLRCRRHKVRCDRRSPCGRCQKLNKRDQCVYPSSMHDATAMSLEDERIFKHIATAFVDLKWDKRFRNGTHWAGLLRDMTDCLPPDHGKHPRCVPTGEPKALSINFPFCADEGSGDMVKDLLSELPPPTMQRVFVEHYKDTIERLYHLIDNDSWDQETRAFWEKTSSPQHDWFAQYFMVLSLGCQAYNCAVAVAGDGSQQFEDLPRQLLQGAKLCLQRSPFMFRASLANIRTLCLMIIAKHVYTLSCHEADTCWPLSGIAVRLSISMGLHLNDSQEAQVPSEGSGTDSQAKQKLWETVVLLEMRQSLVCGMPLLLRSESLKIGGLFGGCGQLLMKALEIATSQEDITPYSTVVEVDAALRAHLPLFNLGDHNLQFPTDDLTNPIDLEACKMEIFSRQVLMALHSRFAFAPDSASLFPTSYFSSLESALSLLSKQRLLCDSGPFGKQYTWLAGFFRHEFFSAAMAVCYQLVRGTQAFANSSTLEENKTPADIMLDALESCSDIWKRESQMSICSSKAFIVTDNLVRTLRGRS